MPATCLIPRHRCSARNAFNPSAALVAAFLLSSNRPLSSSRVAYKQKSRDVEDHDRDLDGTQPLTSESAPVGVVIDEHQVLPRKISVKKPGWKDRKQLGKIVQSRQNALPGSDSWKLFQQQLGKRAQELSQKNVSTFDTAEIQRRRLGFDYDGKYIDVPETPLSDSLPVPWLSTASETLGMTPRGRLSVEIDNFARWMDCTPVEVAARTSLIEEITRIIARSAGSAVQVNTFGSQEIGMATFLSDIDIRLSFHDGPPSPRMLLKRMISVETALFQSPDFMLVSLRNSRFPIINAQHKHTGIDIQIVSRPDTNAQREAMVRYLRQIPALRSVYMVLKAALGIRGLVDVFNGGIGSYGLFMMLVASIQRPHSSPPKSTSGCLRRFLGFYTDLDMTKYGISVSPPKKFKKHDAFTMDIKAHIAAARRRGDYIRAAQWVIGQTRLYQPYLFCLQDPANPLNDLGRKSNAIKHLRRTLVVFKRILGRSVKANSANTVASRLGQNDSMLLPLVGRCHEIYRDRRTKIEEQGALAVKAQTIRDAASRSSDVEIENRGVVGMEDVETEQKAAG